MRHGCYKLCPRVREQLQKAREAEETSDDSEFGLDDRAEGVAGPSGVRRRRRSEERSKSSSDEAREKRKHVKKKTPGKSNDTSKSRNKEQKKGEELEEPSRRKKERNGEKGGRKRAGAGKQKDREVPGPSRTRRKRKGEDSSRNESDNRSFDRHDNCDRNCRGIDEIVEKMQNDEQQETFDEYIINKGRCYFEDLCNCQYVCMIDQLWKDPFVTSTIASAALFAIGLKLCSELDGWRIIF